MLKTFGGSGYRESEANWPEAMEQLVSQGLSIPAEVDGVRPDRCFPRTYTFLSDTS